MRHHQAGFRVRAFLARLCTALLMGTVVRASEPPDPNRPTTPEALKARMEALMAKEHVPGVSYTVFDRNGMVLEGALGYADVAQKRPATRNTLMRAGSITKTLTAIAVMQLIEQGRFSLSTPVRDLLPEAPIVNPWEATDPVRVVHLLEHSAGLDDTSLSKLFSEREVIQGHLGGVLADPKPLRARYRPGTLMSYSSPGYAVLGALLEKQTGLLWEDLLRRDVLQPMGMTQSVLTIAEAQQREHGLGYRGVDVRNVPILFMSDRAAGALWTTPHDLSLLGRFLMTDGQSAPGVLKPETVRDMKTVHSTGAARQGLNWGYSLGFERSAAQGAEWLGHNGGVYGAAAMLQYQPQRELGYVVLVNTEEVGELADPLVGYIVVQKSLSKVEPPCVEITGDINGWYRRYDNRPELGAGINWLIGVMHVWRNDSDPRTVLMNEPLGTPSRFSSPDNRLLTSKKTGFTRIAMIRSGDRVEAIDNNGYYLARVSAFSALAPISLISLSLLALITVPFGRRKALQNPWLRRLPTLALLSLIASIALMFQLEITTLGKVNAVGMGIFLSTLLMPLFALAGLVLGLKTWRTETARVARWRCLVGSLGAVGISIYFASFHWFALAIWKW